METQEKITYIVDWLKDYSDKGFVIGVSGGVDSATTSKLCALTGRRIIVVNMAVWPLKDYRKNKKQLTLATEHMAELVQEHADCESISLELTPLTHIFKLNMSEVGCSNDLAMANSTARFRMLTLYHIAQANDLLVCGTGNKVEDFGVGFYTKYGDGGVDISPIGDLMKSEVYELARELKVNQNIIDAAPTDGLWFDGRTDEDQLGITYDEAEWAMRVDEKKIDPKSLDPISERKYNIYKDWNTKNAHKMKPIPVCKMPDEVIEVETGSEFDFKRYKHTYGSTWE